MNEPDEPVNFDVEGVCTAGDFTHAAAPFDTITIVNGGDYQINYSVIFRNADGMGAPTAPTEGAYAVFVSTGGGAFTEIAASRFGLGVDLPSASSLNTNLQVNGDFIFTFSDGDQIRLINIGNTTHHLANSVDGAQVNSASLTIVQLNTDTE
jgi:hypothetical protein